MLLIDTYNLYNGACNKYDRLIDYDRLIHYIRPRHQLNGLRFAYVAQTDQSRTFANFLRSRQFAVRSKPIDKCDSFDVELTVDALSNDSKELVICSSSMNLFPLIECLTDVGRVVTVYTCGVPYMFKEVCNAYELPIGVMRVQEGAYT